MTRKFITVIILLLCSFININLLNAKSDEEIRYALALEKRQEYCTEKYNIYSDDAKFIQPLMALNQKNIKEISNLFCMATFYEENAKLDEAMQNYLDILKLEPNFVDIIIKVGDYYKNTEYSKYDFDKAALYYRDALEIIDGYLTNDINFLDKYIEIFNKVFDTHNEKCVLGVDIRYLWEENDKGEKTNELGTVNFRNFYKCQYKSFSDANLYDEIFTKLNELLENRIFSSVKTKINKYILNYRLDLAESSYNSDNTNNRNEAIRIYEELINNLIADTEEHLKNYSEIYSEAVLKLSEIYFDMGYLNQAKELLEYGEKTIPDFKADEILKGKIYYNLGQYNDVISILTKASLSNFVREDISNCSDYKGISKVVEFNDIAKNTDTFNLIKGADLKKLKNYSCFEKASKNKDLTYKETNIYYYRGRAYTDLNQCYKAKEDFQKAQNIIFILKDLANISFAWSNIKCN